MRASGAARGAARTPSAERRQQVLDHAVGEFARRGLKGATTEAIAARCGVSQPYLFRLFGSKAALFIAALERGFDLAEAETAPLTAGEDDVSARSRLIQSREGELAKLVLQGCAAACDDAQVAALLRKRLHRIARRCDRSDEDLLAELLHTAGGFALRDVADRLEGLAP